MTAKDWREPLMLGVLIVSAVAWRAQRSDQPILEGYVGRQVPTAMVARNLNRGWGFFSPQLDTGPFPNLFLVEPPIYAQVVAWIAGASGLAIERTGRLVSAASIGLACWGLHGLVRRREGGMVAIYVVAALCTFPTTIKYGRAVQPDAFTLGLAVAGLRAWDEPGRSAWRWVGWSLCGLAFAQKLTWSFMLLPLLVGILRDVPARVRWLAASTLLPALAWYAFVAYRFAGETGGTASSVDNAANWLDRLSPASYLDARRWGGVAVDLAVRSFSVVGFVMVGIGLMASRSVTRPRRLPFIPSPLEGEGRVGGGVADQDGPRSPIDPPPRPSPSRGEGGKTLTQPEIKQPSDRLWASWTVAGSLVMLALFGKLHHDYYWLMLAAPFAAWAGIGIGRIPLPAWVPLVGLLVFGLVQSRSAWRTPDDWRDAPALAEAIRKETAPGDLVIAPEAVLYMADRRGCRLEVEPGAVRRAANEWRPVVAFGQDDPEALVDYYREQAGARVFADLDSPGSRPFHDALKRRPGARVIEDVPGHYLILGFDEPKATRP